MGFKFNPFTGNFDLVNGDSGSTITGPICVPANTTLVIDTVPNNTFTSVKYQITSGDLANNTARNLNYEIYNMNNVYQERKSSVVNFGTANWFFFVNDTANDEYGDPITYGGGAVYGGTGTGTGNLELTVTNNESFEICVTFDKLTLLF